MDSCRLFKETESLECLHIVQCNKYDGIKGVQSKSTVIFESSSVISPGILEITVQFLSVFIVNLNLHLKQGSSMQGIAFLA